MIGSVVSLFNIGVWKSCVLGVPVRSRRGGYVDYIPCDMWVGSYVGCLIRGVFALKDYIFFLCSSVPSLYDPLIPLNCIRKASWSTYGSVGLVRITPFSLIIASISLYIALFTLAK